MADVNWSEIKDPAVGLGWTDIEGGTEPHVRSKKPVQALGRHDRQLDLSEPTLLHLLRQCLNTN